jgi:flavodoxin
MKSIVVYYSESGNTEKVAKAIASAIAGDIKRVEETKSEELADYDLIFIGTPVHGSRPARKIEDFLDELPELSGKKAAAFCTMHLFGDETTFQIIKEKLEKKGIIFIDSFSCLGWSRLVGNFGPRIFNRGRPNKEDLRKANEFAKGVIGE